VTEPALLYEKDGHIATLTMNRPAARNAVNPEMLCRLADAWEDVNADPEIRVAIRVAAADAQFGLAEVKWSLFPMGGSTVRIPRQIPWPIAMEIMLTGERISAQEAYRVCLVNKVVPAAQVLAEARRYAEIIAANGPLAVQAVKRSALTGLGLPTGQALEKELEIGIPVSMSNDAREGPTAFKEKRAPRFTGT
jgi:enoyl-CoA hydratase